MNFKFLTLIIFCLIFLLSLRFFSFYSHSSVYHDGQAVKFQTTLFSEPRTVGRYQRLSANLDNKNKISILTSVFPEYHYGQTLEISGVIRVSKSSKISSQSTQLPVNERTVMTIFYPKIKAVEKDNNFSLLPINLLLAVTSSLRQNLILLFEKTLPAASSSLMLGIVFGIKENMPGEFTNSLRLSGVFHVVAASGMNVTMVGGFLSSVFLLFLKRQYALFLTIFGIGFYTFLAGLEPSIIRASIMGVLAFSAQILGRQRLSSYSLFLAGFIMLFVSPDLLSDIGFQLSFLATLGLIYIRPLFKGNFWQNSVIGESVTTTFAAQVATLPILLANFGTYSLFSILVNALVLWMIPVLMVLGGLGTLGILVEPIGQLFLYLSLPFLLYFQKVVTFFGGLGGIISINYFPWQIVLGYYFLLVAIIVFLERKN